MANSLWVSLSHLDTGTILVEHRKTYTSLFQRGALASQRTPAFVTLVGKRAKSALLRQLLGGAGNDLLRDSHHQVHVWTDPRTLKEDSPLVLLDCELQHYSSRQWIRPADLGEDVSRQIEWLSPGSRLSNKVGNEFCARVLAPLSNVVCLFASDLGGIKGVAKLLAEHAIGAPPSDLPAAVLPRVIMVIDTNATDFDESIAESKLTRAITEAIKWIEPETEHDVQRDLSSSYHDIRVLGLKRHSSPTSRATAFRKRISSVSDDVQLARQLHNLLFNFNHFRAFSGSILHQFCSTPLSTFHFVQASRPAGYKSDHLATHLQDVISKVPSQAHLWHAIIPLLASAMLLASYPPGSHSKVYLDRLLDL